MRIAIIGAGSVGTALGRAWAKGDHDIVFGSRKPDNPELVSLCEATGATAAEPRSAADGADVIVLALPFDAAEHAVRELGDLEGRIVIDAMNPLKFEDGMLSLDRGFTTSGGEELQGWIPGARVVKAMNQIAAELMDSASDLDGRPVMFVAGNDDDAKSVVRKLVDEIGFETLDAGGIEQSRLLEPLAMTYINQAMFRGEGRDWAFGIRRSRAQ